ncbi:MAG: MBL fold metallo-hydrolase [Myxococcales bacterium]
MTLRSLPLAVLALSAACPVPMGPDRPELARFVAPPAAPAPPAVTVEPLLMASRHQPACGLAGDASCLRIVEMVYAAWLVRHPTKGTFLIDAGLGHGTRQDLGRFSLFPRLAFAADGAKSLGELLAERGDPSIDFVVLTHVHWDHTSGLGDLPGVKVLTTPEDAAYVGSFRGPEPSVMPEHFQGHPVTTFAWDGPARETFPASHDLFGDGSVVLVPLPGHTPGSLGVLLGNVHGHRVLFVGDAVWSSDGIRLPSQRPRPLSRLVDFDPAEVSDTLWRLRHLHERDPGLTIVPAHDGAALRAAERL